MALLGDGFNPQEPADSDLVKYGASWMRDIKNRLKGWGQVLFDLNTGRLRDNVIASSKLKSLSPDPAGAYNWGSVNSKGQVTAGQDVEIPSRGRAVSEMFIGSILEESASTPVSPLAPGAALRFNPDTNAFYTEVNDEWILTSADTEGDVNHWSARKLWTVPTGVTQVRVVAIGGGGGGELLATPYGGAGGTWAMVNFIVEPQQQWELWIGSGGEGGATNDGHDGTLTRFYLDATRFVKCKGGNGAKSGAGGTVPFPMSNFGTGHTTQYIGIQSYGEPGGQPNGGACGNGCVGGFSNNYVGKNYGAGGAGDAVQGQAGGPGVIILDYIY